LARILDLDEQQEDARISRRKNFKLGFDVEKLYGYKSCLHESTPMMMNTNHNTQVNTIH